MTFAIAREEPWNMERVQNSVVIIRWRGFGFLEKSVRFLPDCCFQLLYYWLLLLNCCCSYVDQLKQTLLFQVDPFLEEIVCTLQWCSYAYSVEMDVEITTKSKVIFYFEHGWISWFYHCYWWTPGHTVVASGSAWVPNVGVSKAVSTFQWARRVESGEYFSMNEQSKNSSAAPFHAFLAIRQLVHHWDGKAYSPPSF